MKTYYTDDHVMTSLDNPFYQHKLKLAHKQQNAAYIASHYVHLTISSIHFRL